MDEQLPNVEQAEEQEFPSEHLYKPSRNRIGVYQCSSHPTEGRKPKVNREVVGITRLWNRHHIVKRMLLTGASRADISAATGLSPVSITAITNSQVMQKEIAIAQGFLDKEAFDVASEIQKMHPKALHVLTEILDDINAPISLRAKVAMDNLSRGGYSPVVRGSVNINHSFSKEEIEAIKQDAIASGIRLGTVVDAEFTECQTT